MNILAVVTVLIGFTLDLVSDGGEFVQLNNHPWLDPASIQVSVNGSPVSWELTARGAATGILLSPAPDPGDSILIEADTLNISAPKLASLDVSILDRGDPQQLSMFSFGGDPIPEGLYLSGSKRLGVSVGSGGGISQGTELSIQGMLARGITIDGRITDRDLPLGAGASEAVSELDRIYVELDGGTWSAAMGDLEWESTRPLRWRTDAAGFLAGVTPVNQLDLSGGYGTTGAERRRNSFLTEEGLQGPYVFAADGGVTPGSERVFLDGELLSRGTGADYQVDYSGGMITFTTVRLIRRDQRVDVSWYREGDGFRKDVLQGSTLYTIGTGAAIEFKSFSRSDNTGVPLGFVITDEIIQVLEQAGENPEDAWIDGGRYVGENNGSYTVDSLMHYLWVGPDQGDWSVEFQRPPDGAGDYIYDSALGGYLWAGEGSGTHLPRRYVTIPSSNTTAGVAFTGNTGVFRDISVHSFYSKNTGNLFNQSNTTREGTFSGGSIGLLPWVDGPSLTLSGRYVSHGFIPPDELDQDDELQRWGLPSGWAGNDNYLLGEIQGDRIKLAAGRRQLQDRSTVEIAETGYLRTMGNLTLNLSADGMFRDGSLELAPGKRGVFHGDISLRTGDFTPFISPSYTAEEWSDSLSGALMGADAGFIHQVTGWETSVSAGGEVENRDGSGNPDRTLRISLSSRGSGISWNTTGSFQHSTGWFDEGGSTSSDAVKASYSGRSQGLWVHGKYTAGGYISREMDIVYTWVGAGNGDYSFDPETGEYYFDPSGEYIQTFTPGEGENRVLETALDGGFSWADSVNSAGLDGSFLLSASDADDRLKTYTLAGAFDTSFPGGWTASVSPYLSWDSGTLSRLTLHVSGFDDREQYSGVGITRESYRKLQLVPLLKPEEWLEIQVEVSTAHRRRSLYGVRETDENAVSADPVVIWDPGFETGLRLSAERRNEPGETLSAVLWGIEPHVSLNLSGWTASGRFTSSFISDADGNPLPAWFFDGRQPGWTIEPTLSVNRNLNRWFQIGLFYWGRKRPESPWEQRGGIEGTVNF